MTLTQFENGKYAAAKADEWTANEMCFSPIILFIAYFMGNRVLALFLNLLFSFYIMLC